MRPIALEIHRFRGWDEGRRIDLGRPITLLVGENGWGKSSTLNAPEWCLFGGDIEIGGSGIDERKAWDARHRGAAGGPMEVALTLEDPAEGRTVCITRSRPASGRSKDDVVTVEIRSGPDHSDADHHDPDDGDLTLEGDGAARWISANLPDWHTFRRAHIQHQSAVRQRVFDSKDRSAVLELLLGLDEDAWLRDGLDSGSVSGSKLIGQIDEELDNIERQLERELERPQQEIREAERRIASLGVERARIGPSLITDTAQRLVQRGRGLADRLQVEADLPAIPTADGPPPDEVLVSIVRWAEDWPKTVRGADAAEKSLSALRTRRRQLTEGLQAAQAAADGLAQAESALKELQSSHGDLDTCRRAVSEAEGNVKSAEAQLARANELAALLERARSVVTAGAGNSTGNGANGGAEAVPAGTAGGRSAADDVGTTDVRRCPVCDQEHPDLLGHIDAALANHGSDQRQALQRDVQEAKETLQAARASLQRVEKHGERVDTLGRALAERREQLRQTLAQAEAAGDESAADDADGLHDPLAAARRDLETMAGEIEEAEAALNQRDAALSKHADDLALLRELRGWLATRRRASQRVDVTTLPPWDELQQAVDRAAGLAADQEALANIARSAQEERSKKLVDDVNEQLGRYLQAILGEAVAGDVRVSVRGTAKNIYYELKDGDGEDFVHVSNQAKLNAVSLALLFAQAEAQAREGKLAWAIVDDPVQSLDERHQHGLATAIEMLSEHCPVLVSATPGEHLVERVVDFVSQPRRIVHLSPLDVGASVGIEEVRDL